MASVQRDLRQQVPSGVMDVERGGADRLARSELVGGELTESTGGLGLRRL